MRAPRHDVLALGAIAPVSRDDRAIVYTAPDATVPGGGTAAYREYRRSTLADADTDVLAAMCEHLAVLTPAAAGEVLAVAAWPSGIVESAGLLRGIVIPPVPGGLGPVTGAAPSTEHDPYAWLSTLAAALSTLHRHDIVVGDLVTAGLMVPVARDATAVYFGDADRMLLLGRSPWPPAEAPGWEIGSSHPGEAPVTPESDAFKLGMLTLRTLSNDQATRDPSALPSDVPADVRQLVEAALSAAPGDRPTPGDWLPALDTAPTSPGRQRTRAAEPAAPSGPDETPTGLVGAPDEPAAKTVGDPALAHSGGTATIRRRRLVLATAAATMVALLAPFVVMMGSNSDPDTTATGQPGDGLGTGTTPTTGLTPPTTRRQATTTTTAPPRTTTTSEPSLVDGWFAPDVPDDCSGYSADLLDGDRALISCYDSLVLLDLATGEVTNIARATSPNGDVAAADAVVGDRYVWWETVDTPASGLDPPYRTLTLRSRSLTGGNEEDLLELEGDQEAYADILYAWGLRFLSLEFLEGDSLTGGTVVLRDTEGAELARFDEFDGFYDDRELFDGIVGSDGLAIDVTRAEVVPDDAASISSVDPCTQTGISWASYAIVHRDSDGLRVDRPIPADLDANIDAVMTGDRLLGYRDGLTAFAADGTPLWELPTDVATHWAVFGGIPFVVNDSEEVVPVDPATGTETTVAGDLHEAAEIWLQVGGYAGEGTAIDVDSATGDVLLQDDQGRLKLVNLPECKIR